VIEMAEAEQYFAHTGGIPIEQYYSASIKEMAEQYFGDIGRIRIKPIIPMI